MAETTTDRLVRLPAAIEQTGLSRSTIYRRMAEGTFPLAVDVGGGQVRWWQSEITAWASQRGRIKLRRPAALPEAAAGR